MVHLRRSLPWDQVAPSTRQVEQTILTAVFIIFRLQIATSPSGARLTSSSVWDQRVLPLRHGDFGLQMSSSVQADAALLSGAAMAQAASNGSKDTCIPFNGGCRLSLLAVWQRVYDETTDTCGWTLAGPWLDCGYSSSFCCFRQRYDASCATSCIESGERLRWCFLSR